MNWFMRKRYSLSLDMENSRHREAAFILNAQPQLLRSEYVVNCVLAEKQAKELESMIRRAIREELQGASFKSCSQKPESASDPESLLSDLPDSLIHAMDEM